MRGAVEAMGADFALGEANALNQGFNGVELEGSQAEMAADFLNHGIITGRIRSGILIKMSVRRAFELFDYPTGQQLHIALGGGEADILAAINQRGARNAHMHFLGAAVVEFLDIVIELSAAHDGVITEKGAFSLKHSTIGDKFHLGDEGAH